MEAPLPIMAGRSRLGRTVGRRVVIVVAVAGLLLLSSLLLMGGTDVGSQLEQRRNDDRTPHRVDRNSTATSSSSDEEGVVVRRGHDANRMIATTTYLDGLPTPAPPAPSSTWPILVGLFSASARGRQSSTLPSAERSLPSTTMMSTSATTTMSNTPVVPQRPEASTALASMPPPPRDADVEGDFAIVPDVDAAGRSWVMRRSPVGDEPKGRRTVTPQRQAAFDHPDVNEDAGCDALTTGRVVATWRDNRREFRCSGTREEEEEAATTVAVNVPENTKDHNHKTTTATEATTTTTMIQIARSAMESTPLGGAVLSLPAASMLHWVEEYVLHGYFYNPQIRVHHNVPVDGLFGPIVNLDCSHRVDKDKLKFSGEHGEMFTPNWASNTRTVAELMSSAASAAHDAVLYSDRVIIRHRRFDVTNVYEAFHAYLNTFSMLAVLRLDPLQVQYVFTDTHGKVDTVDHMFWSSFNHGRFPVLYRTMWEEFILRRRRELAADAAKAAAAELARRVSRFHLTAAAGGITNHTSSSSGTFSSPIASSSTASVIQTTRRPQSAAIILAESMPVAEAATTLHRIRTMVQPPSAGQSMLTTNRGALTGKSVSHHCKSPWFRAALRWMRRSLYMTFIEGPGRLPEAPPPSAEIRVAWRKATRDGLCRRGGSQAIAQWCNRSAVTAAATMPMAASSLPPPKPTLRMPGLNVRDVSLPAAPVAPPPTVTSTVSPPIPPPRLLPPVFRVLWSSRRGGVGRMMNDDRGWVNALRRRLDPFDYEFVDVDFAAMNATESIKVTESSDIFVSAHGAALMWSAFLPRHAAVIELFGGDRPNNNRHYHNVAALADVHYRSHEVTTRHGVHLSWNDAIADAVTGTIRDLAENFVARGEVKRVANDE